MADLLAKSIFSGQGPERKTVDLDPNTQQMINDSVNRANQDPSAFADKMNAGVGSAGDQAMQSPDQAGMQAAGLGGGNAAQGAAIRNKYKALAGKDIGQIQRMNQINAPEMKGNALHQGAQMAMAQQQVKTANFEALSKAYADNQMARASVLSGILGTAGGAAGSYMGGRGGGDGNGSGNDNSRGSAGSAGIYPTNSFG